MFILFYWLEKGYSDINNFLYMTISRKHDVGFQTLTTTFAGDSIQLRSLLLGQLKRGMCLEDLVGRRYEMVKA